MSFAPERSKWPGSGRPLPAVILAVLLACLIALSTALTVISRRDQTIAGLRAELRLDGRQQRAGPARQVYAGGALISFSGRSGASFTMVTALFRPRPGAAPRTWLFVYGSHARPGVRYGLLGGTCGGQYVTSEDLADGTASRAGKVTMVVPDLGFSPRARRGWVLIYRWSDGRTLGGIRGPFTGGGWRPFSVVPPC